MPTSDTSERGLENIICKAMTGRVSYPPGVARDIHPCPESTGWILGQSEDYNRFWTVDLYQLREFLSATQKELIEPLDIENDSPTRQKFFSRLQGEITKYGIINVLRNGIKHGPHNIDLFYGTPSPGNIQTAKLFDANRFSLTRQLRYSKTDVYNALDLVLFINGLPIATFELKNNLTKQTVEDAVEQYRRDRDPREKLFEFCRCIIHLALDENEVRFTTHLKGKGSWFLPFNRGYNEGAGNPPNPSGVKTEYLWKEVLTPRGLADIREN